MVILWIVLFLLIIGISFVLAYLSMKDYRLTPKVDKSDDYALYLIRKPSAINITFLNNLHKILSESGNILSFERLFKGGESALVVFGPRKILTGWADQLSLMELENYTDVNKDFIYGWEVGLKDEKLFLLSQKGDLFENFPLLLPQEQFFWQVALMSEKGVFLTEIRAILVSDNAQRRKEMGDNLQHLNPHLIKLPKSFSSSQILEFYKSRSLNQEKAMKLTGASIVKLLEL